MREMRGSSSRLPLLPPLLLLLLLFISSASAFPGGRLIKNWRERRKARAEQRQGVVATEPLVDNAATAATCDDPSQPNYPPGALPLLRAATDAYASAFPGEALPSIAAQAPGRVNLIGEHTDYTGGFVLPLALEKRTVVVGSGAVVDVGSADSDCTIASIGMEGSVSFDADPSILEKGDPFWANYVKGVVKQYSLALPTGKKLVFKAAFASDVPLGAGLSSSAALEVATATFLEGIAGVDAPAPEEKALRCQAAEHEFCGMPCGIMDQFISVLGTKNHLLQIDCRINEGTNVPLGPSRAELPVILVTNSKVKHQLTGSEYPSRVAQCNSATSVLAAAHPAVKQLRDATPDMLEAVQQSAETAMDDETYRRARHVIGENQRVENTVAALAAGDFAAAGKLMVASHLSLKNDFEVSVPELDALVELATAFDGVYGARMTGGGFGGCIVSLVKADAVDG
jgi:galactokinase